MTEAERYAGKTPFQSIYDAFFTLVTDDMYLEWYEDETNADIKNIFLACLPKFQFPKFKLYDYEKTLNLDGTYTIGDEFNFLLDEEEIMIFSNLMIIEWFTRQMASADITKQKYSTSDFKFTSQAEHLNRLISLKKEFLIEVKALQRMYKRHMVTADGYIRPNYSGLGGKNDGY